MAFRRGDGVMFTKHSTTWYIDRPTERRLDIELGVVTSVTRSGAIKKFLPVRMGAEIAPERLGFGTGVSYQLPQAKWDIEAVMAYCAQRPWAHKPECLGAPFETVEQAREELAQFRVT